MPLYTKSIIHFIRLIIYIAQKSLSRRIPIGLHIFFLNNYSFFPEVLPIVVLDFLRSDKLMINWIYPSVLKKAQKWNHEDVWKIIVIFIIGYRLLKSTFKYEILWRCTVNICLVILLTSRVKFLEPQDPGKSITGLSQLLSQVIRIRRFAKVRYLLQRILKSFVNLIHGAWCNITGMLNHS